ncbi:hypothetical protein ABZW18_20295 [Streptomyces sp. NPDC004647]|uniref:hypothetical protein n=1 Tax=Streptomyces sp. NPDC004647 TaxID=3154671 RepID=UPI0033B1642F
MGLDGLQSDVQTLKTEGASLAKVGKDFEKAVTTLIDGLHHLGGGPPSKPPQPGSQPAAPSTAQQFVTGLTTLDSKSGAPPWGDDDMGEKFGVVYEGLRDGMYESMGHIAAKLQEMGNALKDMAKNHEANEDFNHSLMQQHIDNSQGLNKAITNLKSPHH